jgi:hypothetical protein
MSILPEEKKMLISLQEQNANGRIWPSEAYTQQVDALKAAIGSKIYLIEIHQTDINISVSMTDKCYELVDVMAFPRPDPEKVLLPHLILLGDGRGINLGRIARITVNTPFGPPDANILYQDASLMQRFLLQDRRLTQTSIAAKSKALLGRILGKTVDEPHKEDWDSIPAFDASTLGKEETRPP